jgi:hypothetical protein
VRYDATLISCTLGGGRYVTLRRGFEGGEGKGEEVERWARESVG